MFLSEETAFTICSGDGRAIEVPVWRTVRRGVIPRLGLMVSPGDRVVFPSTSVVAHSAALVTFGAARDGSSGGLCVTLRFRPDHAGVSPAGEMVERELHSETMPDIDPRSPWVERRFRPALPEPAKGSFIVECAGPCGAELALYEFVVSDEDTLELERARAFRSLRLRNEKANFDAYYKHSLFQPADAAEAPAARPAWVSRLRSVLAPRRARSADSAPAAPATETAEAPPAPVSAFRYAHDLLLERLEQKPPSFGLRLADRVAAARAGNPEKKGEGAVRILSLCSGEARIEDGLVHQLPAGSVRLTLLDMNPDLLAVAQRRLSRYCPVETIVADVNEIRLGNRTFDLTLCVSGLHHVVELEHLFDEVAGHLERDGEFWSIGETLGRNGGRMWPESYQVANDFFRKLPRKYRVNRTTGGGADEDLLDLDFSVGCFEGIRCESIEPVLGARFAPVAVSRHNCILWKLVSPTYSDNYDMQCSDDRALVEEAVRLEMDLFRRGGKPVELNGIYALPR